MRSFRPYIPFILAGALPVSVLAGDILSTDGVSTCISDPDISVKTLNVVYNRANRQVTFDVAGSSAESQKVLLNLVVTAYGQQIYTKEFNPCDNSTGISESAMEQMCPVPAGTFSSQGVQTVPEKYASQIPSIAFQVPDLDGLVKLQVKNAESGAELGCIQSSVGNGHTASLPAAQYAAAGMAAAALAMSAVGAIASGGGAGATSPSPTFGEVIGWFQSMATNGMLSVQYPKVYQAFTTNFGFSCGLVQWSAMQTAIDNFRAKTGGNVTDNNYKYLKNNVTLVYDDGTNSTVSKRALDAATRMLITRDGATVDVNGTSQDVGGSTSTGGSSASSSKDQKFVSGLQSYAEQLSIPSSNTFMTILLVWAIAVAAIIVLILIFKAILEAWAQCGKLSPAMEPWRKRYWWRMAKAITNLMLLLYGVWTLWCVYQWSSGDSWAAQVLAGVTFAVFTAVLAGFTWKIWSKARAAKKMEGTTDKLYNDKDTWMKYSLFYDNYKKSYWWIFIPTIIYMFARGAIIAGANGHGLVQVCGQLIVESLMLILLLWSRPYQRRSGKWINIFIQVTRVASVVMVLIFVEELGISQTTKTVTGVVLIAVQASLTGILAILIAVNAIITCVKENPHRKKRKEQEKLERDLDNLTPLHARNSLLMDPMVQKFPDTSYKAPLVSASPFADARGRYDPVREASPSGRYRDDEALMPAAAPFSQHDHERSLHSRSSSAESRQPRLPDLQFGRAL
ncbi:hypothetical protein DOTSEDRAFT_73027 [Dothistroma septosporum NZE10]|uniref:ML-like domain-containing protein n=1 Tax=Dothistroma septosporum (strain NZE10 / CBS 128990) TaxID=675120 RepID=N1PLD6_DOTSN|nr:hypothetical protein DOTSEDRAFT_73027 [Dothistroma septosporum NZE10]